MNKTSVPIPRTQTESGFAFSTGMYVRLQNLPWYKTGLVSRQVLQLLSKLQKWICPKTGQCKTYIVSNTKIEAPIRATKPKPWQSHLTSETVEIFIQNEKAGLVPMQNLYWEDSFGRWECDKFFGSGIIGFEFWYLGRTLATWDGCCGHKGSSDYWCWFSSSTTVYAGCKSMCALDEWCKSRVSTYGSHATHFSGHGGRDCDHSGNEWNGPSWEDRWYCSSYSRDIRVVWSAIVWW